MSTIYLSPEWKYLVSKALVFKQYGFSLLWKHLGVLLQIYFYVEETNSL